MHLRTYLLMALVLVLSLGMGCGGGSSTTTGGGDPNSTINGTWNLVSQNGAGFPIRIIFNPNGTGSYLFSGGNTSSITWTLSGSQVIISTGSASAATIDLTSSVVNTFVLNSLGQTGTYNRA